MDPKELHSVLPHNALQEMKLAFEHQDFVAAAENIKRSLVSLDDIPLNVAVTGESGSGKSTFINVLRGLGDEEEGAAKTGVVETTVVATPYFHPRHRNVVYWDLPGIETASFKPSEYLELVKFHQFDFFFIIGSERFRNCHIELAQAINAMGKKFYFVRTKIDADLNASRRLNPRNYNEEQILTQIRENCIKGLFAGGILCPRVFLLSSFELEKYDFCLMQTTLERELPSHKRHVFLLSLPNIYTQALKMKSEAFKNQIWKHALASAAKAALPIPGLLPGSDIDYLVKVMKEYKGAFGMDQKSLAHLAQTFDKDINELRSVVRSQLTLQEITWELVESLLKRRELTSAALMVTQYAAGTVPMLGSVAAGGVAFGTAFWLLYSFLTDVAEDAGRVLSKVLENTCQY